MRDATRGNGPPGRTRGQTRCPDPGANGPVPAAGRGSGPATRVQYRPDASPGHTLIPSRAPPPNAYPLVGIHNNGIEGHGGKPPTRQYGFGIRRRPDRPHFGHLSGCTYEEGMSWRKFHFNTKQSQILADATQVEPFLVKYITDLQDAGRLK